MEYENENLIVQSCLMLSDILIPIIIESTTVLSDRT